MQFTEHIMIFPDTVHTLVRESLCRALIRIQGLKLVFTLRQIQEGLRAMGLFPLGLGPRTYMGLGISVPYISPPLIHTRFPGRIKELAEPFDLGGFYGPGVLVTGSN